MVLVGWVAGGARWGIPQPLTSHCSSQTAQHPWAPARLIFQLLLQPVLPRCTPAAVGLELPAAPDTEPTQARWHGSGAVGQWQGHGSVARPCCRAARDGTDTRILPKATLQSCSPIPHCGTAGCTPARAGLGAPFSLHPTHTHTQPGAAHCQHNPQPRCVPGLRWQRDSPPRLSPAPLTPSPTCLGVSS